MGFFLDWKQFNLLTDVKKEELTKLPLTAADLPVGWSLVPDPETQAFIALPEWMLNKMRGQHWISEKEFENYRHECLDLIINKYENN